MAKPKQPLLSLGARGTIGDALTYQKRGQDTIVRKKPIPKDPYSLNQAYQRWDYRDYAYRWTLLSDSEKQIYRTAASRYHITGFSLWMRERLKELTNLVGRWHLDEKSGAIAYDSSKNAYNATIYGASPAAGVIDGSFYFDGINDYLDAGPNPIVTTALTLEAFINAPDEALWRGIIGKGDRFSDWAAGKFYAFNINNLGQIHFSLPGAVSRTSNRVDDALWHHILCVWAKGTLDIYIDGVEASYVVHATKADDIVPGTDHLLIGQYYQPTSRMKGYIDHPAIHSCRLTETEIKRHSERRYPV